MRVFKAFRRQPRILPDLPSGEVEIPQPPAGQEKPDISWFSLLAPPAVMLSVTVLIAIRFQSVFVAVSIAMTVITMLVSLSQASAQIRKFHKKRKERERIYWQFIADTRSELRMASEQQRKAMLEMNPDPSECLRRMERTDPRLWERTPSSPDFLALRAGIGSVPPAVKVKYSRQAMVMDNDPLMMEPQRLAAEFAKVPDAPVTLNLLQSGVCGVAGPEDRTAELLRQLAVQLVTHHGYDDVRLVLVCGDGGPERWEWLRNVPHLWDESFRVRHLICGKAMAQQLLGELHAVFREREKREHGGHVLPHYVFIIEEATVLDDEPILKYLLNAPQAAGLSAIFTAPASSMLPSSCRTIVRLEGKHGELIDRETGERLIFTPDELGPIDLEAAIRCLAGLRLRSSDVSLALPSSYTLLDMLESRRVEDIDLASRWNRNRTFMGMRVPIGASPGGERFFLDLHETGHGPHGLVAGTTGSGKSELLQTIIISLAIHYHPHDVVFVLIDYKGGGMADVFKGMPHLVGTITNLGGNQTARALLSIKSELLRRQRLFSEYGVNNIDRYQKLYYSRKVSGMPPIPHLVMIADEFAELKQDQPEFMKELVSAARVGRSLGVHLILATQKPAGIVDDQIWSNSKFRICLKVQDEADSRDIIKRTDAARIKEPGRAYIQVGSDEIFEMFQSAYSGADYDPDGEKNKRENKAKRIYRIHMNGKMEQIYPLEEEKIARTELPSQLKCMADYIRETAERSGIAPLDGPWLPPLPETLCLDDVLKDKARYRDRLLCAPVGLADDPRGQRQEPLEIDFAQEGNLIVYGAPGTGKTFLLRTLCLSLASLYTPDEVHLYILDFGGASFRMFESLPHCGGVMTLEEETRLKQFIRFIFRQIEERKQIFKQADAAGFQEYRSFGHQMPGIVILIDNYFALSESYEDLDADMIVLAREGFKYGIYLAATATSAALVRYKFAVNFKMALAYSLVEKSEYDSIAGRTEGLEPADLPGRGLVRHQPPLEFQTALPAFRTKDTRDLIREFARHETRRAAPVPVMPAHIHIAEIQDGSERLAIGLSDQDLQPVLLDLAVHPVMMVAGDPMTGKSSLLASWIRTLTQADILVLDSMNYGLFDVLDLPHVRDLSQADDGFIDELEQLIRDRREQMLQCRKTGGDTEALMRSWRLTVFVIDRMSELTGSNRYRLKDLLNEVIRKARGLKLAIIAADQTSDWASNWDDLAKAFRDEQTGVLIGSLKEQSLFSAKLPYGVAEKDILFGDGYLILKNRLTGMRLAFNHEHHDEAAAG